MWIFDLALVLFHNSVSYYLRTTLIFQMVKVVKQMIHVFLSKCPEARVDTLKHGVRTTYPPPSINFQYFSSFILCNMYTFFYGLSSQWIKIIQVSDLFFFSIKQKIIHLW